MSPIALAFLIGLILGLLVGALLGMWVVFRDYGHIIDAGQRVLTTPAASVPAAGMVMRGSGELPRMTEPLRSAA